MYRNSDNKDNRSFRRDSSEYGRLGAGNGFYTKSKSKEHYDNRSRNSDSHRNDPIFDEPEDTRQDYEWSNKQKRSSDGQDNYRGERNRDRNHYRPETHSQSSYQDERRSTSSSGRRSKFHEDPSGALYGSLNEGPPRSRSRTPPSSYYKKKKRAASSSSSSSSSSSDSPDFTQKNKLGDDFFKSMYSRAKENIRTDEEESTSSLIQNVRKEEDRKSLNTPVVDDDDIFLYGGIKEQNEPRRNPIPVPTPPPVKRAPPPRMSPRVTQHMPPQSMPSQPMPPQPMPPQSLPSQPMPPRIPQPMPPQPMPPQQMPPQQMPRQPVENKTTPGGFDSNALQNVLKAIGFNFEMSAQSQLNFGTEPNVPNAPQIPDHSTMQNNQHQEQEMYNPFAQHVTTETAHRNQMIPQQNHNNLPDKYVLNVEPQLVNPWNGHNLLHRDQETQQQPGNSSSDEHLSARKMRLDYLEETLTKLKNQQNELIRKKRRERTGNKHPLIEKNTMLQVEVEDEIKKIRKLAEAAAGITSDDEDKIHYEYFDPGNHWCKMCNVVCTNVYEYLSHLHNKQHKKMVDPYDRPWMSHGKQEKTANKKAQIVAAPLKGTAFLLPVAGYYCSLCDMFAGDQTCAEDHFKTDVHNESYKKYCRTNPAYEEKRKLDMAAGISMMSPPKKPEVPQKSAPENYEATNKRQESPPPLPPPQQQKQKHKEPSPPPPRQTKSTNQQKPRQTREEKKSSSRSQRERKKRWSPGYDEYERMQETKKVTRKSRFQPVEEPRESRDNTTPVDMEIEDDTPIAYRSHKINLEDNDQDIVTAKVIHHRTHSNDDVSNNKTKLAIPFSVKHERSARTRVDSASSGKSREPSEKKDTKKIVTSFKISNDKKTAEQVRKQNALRAKLSAITVPSARSLKKPAVKKPVVHHTPPENIKFKAIVKQRTELAKVAQSAWGHNLNAYGGMMQQYNYGAAMPPQSMPGQNMQNHGQNMQYLPPENAIANPIPTQRPPPAPVEMVTEIKTEIPEPEIEVKEMEEAAPVLDGITISEDKEPPPPGEDITLGDEDGNTSDASGISMEIASDEE